MKIIIPLIILIILVAIGGIFWLNKDMGGNQITDNAKISTDFSDQNLKHVVTLTDNGFVPLMLNIPVGSMVSVINATNETSSMRLNSEPLKLGFELKSGENLTLPELDKEGSYTLEAGSGGEIKLNLQVK